MHGGFSTAWLVFQTACTEKHVLLFLGGRGKDNGWIITFPENSQFNKVSEEVFTKVLTYLTSVPRYSTAFQLQLPIGKDGHTWWGVRHDLGYHFLAVSNFHLQSQVEEKD